MNSIFEQLEINHTFFYQFGLFIVFFIVLSQLYLKPFQKLIEKRKQKLNDDVDSSNELLRAIDSKMAEYQKMLAAARTEARLSTERELASARVKEEAMIFKMKDDLKKEFQKATQQLEIEKRKIEADLQSQVEQLADQLVSKMKGN